MIEFQNECLTTLPAKHRKRDKWIFRWYQLFHQLFDYHFPNSEQEKELQLIKTQSSYTMLQMKFSSKFDDNLIALLSFWKISLDTAKRLFSPNRLFARLKTPGMKVKNAMLCQSICVPFLSFIDSELFILREMSFPSMSVSHMKLIAHYCALTLKSCVLELIWEFEIILSRIVWIHNHSNSRQFIWINLYFDSILLW